MTDVFGQKLLNWLTSMLIAMLIAIIPFFHFWFFELPERMQFIQGFHEPLRPLVTSIEIYVSIFIPLLIWHVSDFLERPRFGSFSVRLTFSYSTVVVLLFAFGGALALATSSYLNDWGCPEVVLPEGVFQFDRCGSWTPEWKMNLLFGLWISICLIALLKLVASLVPRIWKSK